MKRQIVICDICKAENDTVFNGGFESTVDYGELKGGRITACVTFPTLDDICPNCVYRIVAAYVKSEAERLSGAVKDFEG